VPARAPLAGRAPLDARDSNASSPEYALDAARVRALVERLPPRQRQLWGLRFDEGWTIPEIAEATGIGAETVKTHLSRALITVRGQLEPPHV
jgi:RNA polymerase sigma-70 factor (ECF subfamily)